MSYVVQAGDNLSLIARVNGTTVATLMRLNPQIEDANRIYPGWEVRLPAGAPKRETRVIGEVADCSECADEYVDLLHQAEERLFIPLTAGAQREIEQEEAVLEQLMRHFYSGLEGAGEGIVAHKEAFIERLLSERVIDESTPSAPFHITEIRRLAGNRHYAYVRKNSGWRRHRSYSIETQDKGRREGWFDHENNRVAPDKLLKKIKDDLKLKVNFTIYQGFADWCLLEWQSDKASWTPIEGMPPIVSGAEAQAMRFAMGANLSMGYDKKEVAAYIAANATASASLVEGKAFSEIAWPEEESSEWTIRYRDANNKLQVQSLGKFRALARLELSGFAGASAMLAANVYVTAKDGLPQLRGVGDAKTHKDEAAGMEGKLFAGVRADGKVEGAIEWMDTLEEQPEWKTLCRLGVGAGAALGLGVEARVKLKWSADTRKFYFNVHAGVVVGPGAAGELGAEIAAGDFLTMLHCVYNGLMKVDFRRLEDVDEIAFRYLCSFIFYGVITGSTIGSEAVKLGSELATGIIDATRIIIQHHRSAVEREQLAFQTAENIMRDMRRGSESWVEHAPPEVKGRLLDILCYDYWLTPDRYRFYIRERAILKIIESSRSWRDYEEMVSRMNPSAAKQDFNKNRERLIDLMPILHSLKLYILEAQLKDTTPMADRPMALARHISMTERNYA